MGENGVTFRAATLMNDHIQLTVQFKGRDYTGRIDSKDGDFLKRIHGLLQKQENKSMKAIGDLEIGE